ncbi:uncharacterized protein LOC120136393 [Hibiscus syriacus]|uniref:uncharacterized protein LOC120136393 n=1 Tax=Hibiscus syriacus TaxID=106335 RepID=UPI001922652F|nr:uncharacterized protein LOC120136393 [Hibiscus syriacus]
MTVKDEQVRAAMTMKDEWVRAAMTDDNMVVELLTYVDRCDAKRDGDFNASTRRSPTTPLSWSGGGGSASPSAADGFEETSKQVSRFQTAALSRSKGTAGNETTGTTSKRSRRKKTFAELKEEENLLLKEMVSLKKEIASVRATCKEQRAKNEKLKRIKLDLNLQIAKNEPEEVPYCQPRQRVFSTLDYGPSPSLARALDDHKSLLDSCNVGKVVLPDLNMIPVEDDSVAETLYSTT